MARDLTRYIGRFIDETRDHLRRIEQEIAAFETGAIAGAVDAVFRSAHTIKGASRMLKLEAVTETAHRLEDVLSALREGKRSFTPDHGHIIRRTVDALGSQLDALAETGRPSQTDPALLAALSGLAANDAPFMSASSGEPSSETSEPSPEASSPPRTPPGGGPALKTPETVRVQLSRLDELIKLMGELVASQEWLRHRASELGAIAREAERRPRDSARLLRAFARGVKDDMTAQQALVEELHGMSLVMRMLPLAIVLEPAARMARDLARSLGKEADCAISGSEIEIDRLLIDRLADPILHLLRNALDHGIEPPEAREASGKPRRGALRLSARQDGGFVTLCVRDDGRGLDLAAIRDKAVRKGMIAPEQAAQLAEREIIDLIFTPGFSTSPLITDISGRGVGMDAVKRCVVDELQGQVEIESVPGQGAAITLRLPLSLAFMRVLLVEAGGRTFGFSAQQVACLQRTPASAVVIAADRRAVTVDNEFVPLFDLAELLGEPPSRESARGDGFVSLVIARIGGAKLALAVDKLVDERDILIKPLPEHLRGLELVSGMATIGRNALAAVLHAPALLEAARGMRRERPRERLAEKEERPRVLVVDDSLNTREIEKDVLEAHGYDVTLAEDGADGLARAREEDFDAVLTDVEMPNMDGFTLTAALRDENRYRNVPIIIITSRAKEEDKRRGIEAGADAYIVKGSFDQSNLLDTLKSLLGWRPRHEAGERDDARSGGR